MSRLSVQATRLTAPASFVAGILVGAVVGIMIYRDGPQWVPPDNEGSTNAAVMSRQAVLKSLREFQPVSTDELRVVLPDVTPNPWCGDRAGPVDVAQYTSRVLFADCRNTTGAPTRWRPFVTRTKVGDDKTRLSDFEAAERVQLMRGRLVTAAGVVLVGFQPVDGAGLVYELSGAPDEAVSLVPDPRLTAVSQGPSSRLRPAETVAVKRLRDIAPAVRSAYATCPDLTGRDPRPVPSLSSFSQDDRASLERGERVWGDDDDLYALNDKGSVISLCEDVLRLRGSRPPVYVP